jgi:hypothetical protein
LNILDGVTATATELNVLDGIPATLTATELGYVDGVTSAIQTQLNALAGQPRLLATKTAAGADLDFTETNNALYRGYIFKLRNLECSSDGGSIVVQFSTNGGSSYDSGVSDYSYASMAHGAAVPFANTGDDTAEAIYLLGGSASQGASANEFGLTGELEVFHCSSASFYTRLHGTLTYDSTSGNLVVGVTAGRRNALQDTDAFRFTTSSGNLASGEIEMWGVP